MARPADMSTRQLEDALHAVNGKLSSPSLPERARKPLSKHAERLVDQLSIRHEDRADLEEQRRVDAYREDSRGC